MNKKGNDPGWQTIICDRIENGFWYVEACGPNSKETVAYIDDITGRVLYHHPLAAEDGAVRLAVDARLAKLGRTVTCERKPGCIDISLQTGHGGLTASIEPKEMSGAEYDAVYIGLEDTAGSFIDLQSVHVREDGLHLYMWGDVWSEDPSIDPCVITWDDFAQATK